MPRDEYRKTGPGKMQLGSTLPLLNSLAAIKGYIFRLVERRLLRKRPRVLNGYEP
jgi:hypothetical protein